MVTYSTGWGPSSLAKLVYNYNNHSVWYANNYNITIFGRGYQPTYITGGPHPVVIWWYYIVYSIYASIGGILMGSMLPYIAAPWILWDMVTYSIYFPKKREDSGPPSATPSGFTSRRRPRTWKDGEFSPWKTPSRAQVFHGFRCFHSSCFLDVVLYIYCILKDVLNVTVPSNSLAVRNQKLMRS
jgi:hypothetical protein